MNYVAHDCRNSRLPENHKDYCNNRWINKDLTKATTQIPTWKYCRECCKKLNIDFENQKPSDYMSEEEKEMRKIKVQKSKEALKLKINSMVLNKGQFEEFLQFRY